MTFRSYEEFWPYYVAMHSRSATRWVHLTGTLTGLAVTAYGWRAAGSAISRPCR